MRAILIRKMCRKVSRDAGNQMGGLGAMTMRTVTAITATLGIAILLVSGNAQIGSLALSGPVAVTSASPSLPDFEPVAAAPDVASEDLTLVVQRTCTACHNDVALIGGMSLQGYDVAKAAEKPELTEKMIRKLRA